VISPVVCQALAGRIHEVASLSPVVSLRGLLIPLLVSTGSGLLAGLYPAIQTRRIDVLSILRAE
jgi:ABC-type antimicrobial peptide transport system permease subunit